MDAGRVRLETRGDALWLTLDRPDKRNAFDDAMLAELGAALAAPPAGVRAIVLTGAGDAFCAGADLAWMAGGDEPREGVRPECVAISRLYAALDAVPLPVVARVNGPAAGGGVGFVACCDLAVAADHATFRLSEALVGLVPAMIGPYVARRVGPGRAREWALTAERIDAPRALAWGLVSEVVPSARLDEAVAAKLDLLRAAPSGALAAAKAFFRATEGLAPSAAAEPALRAISARIADPEARARIRAFLCRHSR